MKKIAIVLTVFLIYLTGCSDTATDENFDKLVEVYTTGGMQKDVSECIAKHHLATMNDQFSSMGRENSRSLINAVVSAYINEGYMDLISDEDTKKIISLGIKNMKMELMLMMVSGCE